MYFCISAPTTRSALREERPVRLRVPSQLDHPPCLGLGVPAQVPDPHPTVLKRAGPVLIFSDASRESAHSWMGRMSKKAVASCSAVCSTACRKRCESLPQSRQGQGTSVGACWTSQLLPGTGLLGWVVTGRSGGGEVGPRDRSATEESQASTSAWQRGLHADKRGRWAVDHIVRIRGLEPKERGWDALVEWVGPFPSSWVKERDLCGEALREARAR